MSGFSINGSPRSLVEELMTGVDPEIAAKLLDEFAPGHAGDPGVIARIRPERSLFTAIAQNAQPMLTEFATVPGAADAVQRIAVSLWQHAFRRELALKDIEMRETRTEKDESEIHYTIVNVGQSGTFERPIVGVPLPEFIEKRSKQLEGAWLDVRGFREAAGDTIRALRVFALRHGYPINQVGMKGGVFRPSADGGDLRFTFYWSPPAPKSGVAKVLQPG